MAVSYETVERDASGPALAPGLACCRAGSDLSADVRYWAAEVQDDPADPEAYENWRDARADLRDHRAEHSDAVRVALAASWDGTHHCEGYYCGFCLSR